MNGEMIAYICIGLVVGLIALWFTRRMKEPQPPSHLDDLRSQLREAQREGLTHRVRAEQSGALATCHEKQAEWLLQEIEREEHRVRPGTSGERRIEFSEPGAPTKVVHA